jgi:hypothetical protein
MSPSKLPFHFYLLVLNGPEECNWRPFDSKIGALVEPTRKRDKYDYGHDIDIDLSIVCEDPAKLNKEALPRVLGFFIPVRYLESGEFDAFIQRFSDVMKRLAPHSETIAKQGFTLHYVTEDEYKLPNAKNMKKLHKELSAMLDPGVILRHDLVRKEDRFDDVLATTLAGLTGNKLLRSMFIGS